MKPVCPELQSAKPGFRHDRRGKGDELTMINLYIVDLLEILGTGTSHWYGIVVLYLGPESMMPVASALAGIIGAILMFWQRLMRWKRQLVSHIRNRARKPANNRKSA
jgi:hypothetical protein